MLEWVVMVASMHEIQFRREKHASRVHEHFLRKWFILILCPFTAYVVVWAIFLVFICEPDVEDDFDNSLDSLQTNVEVSQIIKELVSPKDIRTEHNKSLKIMQNTLDSKLN